MAMTLKEKLYNYFAIRHLNLMPPEVSARFEDFRNNNDFQGQMKQWVDKKLYGADNPDFGPATPPAPANPYELTAAEWDELYDSLQKTFQNMNEHKDPSVGVKSEYLKATQDFIKEFFGDDTKTFTISAAKQTPTTAGYTVENQLSNNTDSLAAFLEANKTKLQIPFLKNMSDVFSADFTYDKLVDGLKTRKYNKDLDFRKKLERIVGYINYYGPANPPTDRDTWPDNVGINTTTGNLDAGIDFVGHGFPDKFEEWFEIPNKTAKIRQLKADWPKIFDTLINKSKIRTDFLNACEDEVIKKPLSKAMEETDYANKDSDNYVPEKYDDEKNWVQQLQDLKDDTYEDYFRKFTNPSRGTRIFFSPWSQNIMKAFDKEKIKPTDGLEGIISKKDAILNRLDTSSTSKKHFKWFAEKMEFLSKKVPKAYEGALRNGSQMRALVSALIQEAVEDNEIDKAYTALEILSVAKYGLLCSRTFDKLREATKDLKILSDEKLSWNKGPVKDVTTIIDLTARAALIGAAGAFTIARNAFQNSRTKFNKDISKDEKLSNAYKKKQDEIDNEHSRLIASNAAHNVTATLTELNSTTRPFGPTLKYKTNIQINNTNIGDDTTPGSIKYELKNATGPTVTIGGVTVNKDDLQNDVALFNDAHDRQQKEDQWEEKNINPYKKLMAYWDMLETCSKSHSFTLGSMSAKRKAFIANWNDKKEENTPAKKLRNEYLALYGNIRTAA